MLDSRERFLAKLKLIKLWNERKKLLAKSAANKLPERDRVADDRGYTTPMTTTPTTTGICHFHQYERTELNQGGVR